MLKFLKETPVYLSCPHCGKSQHPRLRWAKHHKSLKCRHCKKNIDLRDKPAQRFIGQTSAALSAFQTALDSLQTAAKKAGMVLKGKKKAEKMQKKEKKKAKKKAKGKKKAAKRAAPKKSAAQVGIKPMTAPAAPAAPVAQPDE